MEYTVACNWDENLIDRVDYPEVKSIFAGLPNTPVSGGRSSVMIQHVNEDEIKQYIKRVHEKGWSFDYNINSSCLENRELTVKGYTEIISYLDWVSDLGVDSVTAAVPNLIQIIKKYYPNLKIKVSTFQKINSVHMAKSFEDMGVDAIMLSEHVNRDFELLRAIRKSVKCKLVLMANTGCIYGCPNMHAHANSIAHSGAERGTNTIFTETYAANCLYKRLNSIEEIIKIRWIRPEDVAYYEEIGIDMLKIIDRHSSTEAIAERVKAYHERSFDGNLLDLLGQMINRKKSKSFNLDSIFEDCSIEKINSIMEFLDVFKISIPDLYYLDNKKIPNDFLRQFEKRECYKLSCDTCRYCKNVADAAIKNQAGEKDIASELKKLKGTLNRVVDGTILY